MADNEHGMTRFQTLFLFSATVSATVGVGMAAWRGPAGAGRGESGMPAAPVVSDAIGSYDPAAVRELKREGIDLSDIVEIREMLRTALTAADPVVKMKMALELKRRFGLEADPALLGRLERAGGAPKLTLTERGRRLVKRVVGRAVEAYDRFFKEVDL